MRARVLTIPLLLLVAAIGADAPPDLLADDSVSNVPSPTPPPPHIPAAAATATVKHTTPTPTPTTTATITTAFSPSTPATPTVTAAATTAAATISPSDVFTATAAATATPTATADSLDEVFVPLQKWKEQKLQDIESRVKQGAAKPIKHISGHRGTKEGVVNKRLSRRQVLIKELFSRTCPLTPVYLPFVSPSTLEQPPETAPAPEPEPELEPVATPTPLTSVSPTQSHHAAPAIQSGNPVPSSDFPYVPVVEERSPEPELHSKPPTQQNPVPSTLIETPVAERAQDTFEEMDTRNESAELLSSAASNTTVSFKAHSKSAAPQLKLKDHSAIIKSLEQRVRQLRNSINTVVAVPSDGAKNDSKPETENGKSQPSPTATKTTPTPSYATASPKSRRGSDADSVKEAAEAPAKLTRKSFNFASEGSGAQILAASAGATGAKNIISENKDRYMLARCTGNGVAQSRWVDIELSEYVILQSVQTANFEHYSSSARKFAVLGAEHYPPEKWNVLGVFDFADTRSIQTFHIIGVAGRKVSRFLRVVYAGHRGYEYYCPVSIFRAFGKNLIADLKDGLEAPDRERSKPVNQLSQSGAVRGPLSDSNDPQHHTTGNDDNKEPDLPGSQDDSKLSREDSMSSSSDDVPTDSITDTPESSVAVAATPPGKELSSDDQILLSFVREEALTPVDGDDNIFRRVARMIRLLELNQSLTNQYIDTHLARFASALATVKAEAASAKSATVQAERRAAAMATRSEAAAAAAAAADAAARRRDFLLAALMLVVGILLGTQWVLWSALAGARPPPVSATVHLHHTSPVSSPEGSTALAPVEHEDEMDNQSRTRPARIVETVSVDGVHVELQNVQVRTRRRRRRRAAKDNDNNRNRQD